MSLGGGGGCLLVCMFVYLFVFPIERASDASSLRVPSNLCQHSGPCRSFAKVLHIIIVIMRIMRIMIIIIIMYSFVCLFFSFFLFFFFQLEQSQPVT